MTEDERTMIKTALEQYGGALSENRDIITPCGEKTSVRLKIKRNRIRFEGNGFCIMTASVTPASIEAFVEKYWFWKKVP